MNKQVEERADLTYRLAGLRRGQATRPPFVRLRPRQTENIVKRLNARYKAGLRPAVVMEDRWGCAPRSGFALLGQRPTQGPSPFPQAPLRRGAAPPCISHRAAKP